MHAHNSGSSCPVCGQDYDERIVLSGSVDWRDVYQGRPRSFFEKYHRRCSSKVDAEDDNNPVGPSAIAVYFHADDRPSGSLI